MYTGLLHAEKSCAIWVEAAAVQLQLDWMKGHMRLCMALFGFVATVGEHVAGDHFALAWKPWKVALHLAPPDAQAGIQRVIPAT